MDHRAGSISAPAHALSAPMTTDKQRASAPGKSVEAVLPRIPDGAANLQTICGQYWDFAGETGTLQCRSDPARTSEPPAGGGGGGGGGSSVL